MAELQNASTAGSEQDPLSRLHRMSTTAGVGSGEYVALNPMAITAVVLSVASGLVFLHPVLLVLPIASVALAILSIRQIRGSNGTQGYVWLAAVAIVISVTLAAVVGAREVQRKLSARRVQQQVATVATALGDAIKQRDWQAAYGQFTPDFQTRWPADQFIARMSEILNNPRLGELRSVAASDRLILQDSPTGVSAVGNVMFDFSLAPQPSPMVTEYRQIGGQWKVNDMQSLFPPPEPPGPPGR